MMDSPKNVHIVVPRELRERLKLRKKPHQAIAGVIEELLSQADEYVREQRVKDRAHWEVPD